MMTSPIGLASRATFHSHCAAAAILLAMASAFCATAAANAATLAATTRAVFSAHAAELSTVAFVQSAIVLAPDPIVVISDLTFPPIVPAVPVNSDAAALALRNPAEKSNSHCRAVLMFAEVVVMPSLTDFSGPM